MKIRFLLIGTSLSLIPQTINAQCNASPRKIAPLWAIPRPAAPAAPVSNAPSATNGLASNQSLNFVMNTASLKPAPEDKSESAKLVTVNTPNVPVRLAMSGKTAIANNKSLTEPKEIYIIATVRSLVLRPVA